MAVVLVVVALDVATSCWGVEDAGAGAGAEDAGAGAEDAEDAGDAGAGASVEADSSFGAGVSASPFVIVADGVVVDSSDGLFNEHCRSAVSVQARDSTSSSLHCALHATHSRSWSVRSGLISYVSPTWHAVVAS